jgi:hypothetical protein
LGIEEDCDRKFGWKKLKKKCRSSFCTRVFRKWVLQKKICENWVQARKNKKMHRNGVQQKNSLTVIDFHRNFPRVWVLNRL